MNAFTAKPACPHKLRPLPIAVGDRQITPISLVSTSTVLMSGADILILLAPEHAPTLYDGGWAGTMMAIPVEDYNILPSPDTFDHLLRRVYALCKDYNVMIGCAGGHGRTGYFIAAMIALMEPDTLDPIKAVRERVGCLEMIETLTQAEAVFGLTAGALPEDYYAEFALSDPAKWFEQYPKQWTQTDWERALAKQDAEDDAKRAGWQAAWDKKQKGKGKAKRPKSSVPGRQVGQLSECGRCGYRNCVCYNNA